MGRRIFIENCEYSVEYECPIEWKKLDKTDSSTVRFCNECNKNVYRCKTADEMDEHINLNHCIAINEVREQVMGMIDMPSTPKNKVCKHCLEPPMYCTCYQDIIDDEKIRRNFENKRRGNDKK